MKKILIDTNSINGKRSALVDGEKLIDFDLEFGGTSFQKGSIHKGKITKIEASLEAIFVEMGSSRHGFLPFKELNADYFDHLKLVQIDLKSKKAMILLFRLKRKKEQIKVLLYQPTYL